MSRNKNKEFFFTLDPYTYGDSKAMVVLAKILTEIGDNSARKTVSHLLHNLDICLKDKRQ